MCNKTTLTALAIIVGFMGLAAVSSSAMADSAAQAAQRAERASQGIQRATVFGRFRLLKNGNEIRLGDGYFSNFAALRLYRPADQEEFTGRVEADGEFAFDLAPGEYYLMSVAFRHRGETIEPETNFVINVSPDYAATYVGTLTLETTFSSGYAGMQGTFDRFVVSNDCAADCNRRLASLGLGNEGMTVDLPEWKDQVAQGH